MMKGCCFKYFLLFVVSLQLLDLAVGDVEPQIDQLPAQLSSDGKVVTTQNGKNIELTSGTGFIDLTLSSKTLDFEVCKDKCRGDVTSKICYEYHNGDVNPNAIGSCFRFPSSCEFNVTGKVDRIIFGNTPVFKSYFKNSCLGATIQSKFSVVLPFTQFDSCKPEIDSGNDNMIKLWVTISSFCPITVLNAALYVPPTTTSLPSSSLATASPSKKEETSEASLPWWAILIIAFVVLLAFIAVGAVAFLVYRDHQKAKQKAKPPPLQNPIPEAVVASANFQTLVEKPVEEPAAKESIAKPEPPKVVKPKKSAKKEKTIEPTTTEDAPAEPTKEDPPSKGVKQNDDQEKKTVEPTEDGPTIPSKQDQPPKPVPGSRNPSPTRMVPPSLKSVKTDSLQFVTKKEIIELAESSSVSLENHSPKPMGVDVVAGMKSNYPEIIHDVRKDEVELFCSRVSKMYALVCALSVAAEQTLVSVGCVFDELHRLLFISPDGRRHLNEKHTAASTVCFAFGAEFHEYVIDAPEFMGKASVPLLMVIALQSRFTELVRRKACASLRRKLPLILCNYKAADREKMPFPINVIETAYVRHPIFFRDLTVIQSDSSGERKKKKQVKNVGGQGKPGGAAKAKKKSSKKRH